jgi:hypothetical protein
MRLSPQTVTDAIRPIVFASSVLQVAIQGPGLDPGSERWTTTIPPSNASWITAATPAPASGACPGGSLP